jgi:hypothetical protein
MSYIHHSRRTHRLMLHAEKCYIRESARKHSRDRYPQAQNEKTPHVQAPPNSTICH